MWYFVLDIVIGAIYALSTTNYIYYQLILIIVHHAIYRRSAPKIWWLGMISGYYSKYESSAHIVIHEINSIFSFPNHQNFYLEKWRIFSVRCHVLSKFWCINDIAFNQQEAGQSFWYQLISPWTKWSPFRRPNFQIHSNEWKVMYLDSNFTAFCS